MLCRTSWLPSDLAAEPGYKAIEDALRLEMENAKAADAILKVTWDALMVLGSGSRAALGSVSKG
jgi:hypothetical protein